MNKQTYSARTKAHLLQKYFMKAEEMEK